MRYRAYSFLLLLTCFQPVFAQRIGEPYPVKLLGTSSPLTLEFSDRDYMLIVYSLNADEPPDLKDNPEYGFAVFSVSSGANSETVRNPGASLAAHSGGGLESAASKTRAGPRPPRTTVRGIPAPRRRRSRRIWSAPAGSCFRHSVTWPIRPLRRCSSRAATGRMPTWTCPTPAA